MNCLAHKPRFRPTSRLRSLFLLPLLAIGLLAMAPANASATRVDFNCSLLSPYTYCTHPVWHNYFGAGVSYPGAGSMVVCKQTIRVSNGNEYQSSCGVNVSTASFPRCNCGGLYARIFHTGNVAHNLKGYGQY